MMIRIGPLISNLVDLSAAVFAGCFAVAIAASAQNIPADLSPDCSSYASVPLPPEADRTPIPHSSPDCASYRSYRGIGRSVDYSEARRCAWVERRAQQADLGQNQKEPIAWVVGGSLILADIYFNGAGVERNVPLAMRFACEAEEGMAALALRDINKPSGIRSTKLRFEFCDYAATTLTMNFCGGYASEIEADHRNRFYNALKGSMTPEQRTAFDSLLKAKNAYVKAHALEVDQGGTIRAIRTVGSQSILEDLFRTEVVHFERKKWPTVSEKQMKAAETLVDREYSSKVQRLQRQTKEDIEGGAISADHLSNVQHAWKAYRNAWVSFARLRYPEAVDAIRAKITLDRYRLLKTISVY